VVQLTNAATGPERLERRHAGSPAGQPGWGAQVGALQIPERLSTEHSLVQDRLLMTAPNQITFPGRKTAWIAMLVATLVALAIVLAPVWLIQPFKPQSARGLEVSYALRRWSPLVTLIALVVSVILALRLWRGSRLWRKVVLVILFVPLVGAVWFSRQNHFEWMFNPLAHAAYAKTSEAAFVDDADIVMAVESNGEAAAYPVRLMAYHHLVQDVVGGTPIVATY
jgi:hypothetical protein